MKRCVVSVRAAAVGWVVEAEPLLSALVFRSGAHAEREAYRLGKALARAGCEVELSVHDRSDELLAHISLPPQAAPVPNPLPPPPRSWRPAAAEPAEPPVRPPPVARRGPLRLVAAAGLALV